MRSLIIPQRVFWTKTPANSSPSSLFPKFDGFFTNSKLTCSGGSFSLSRNSRKKINSGQLGNFTCKVMENKKHADCGMNEFKSCSEVKLIHVPEHFGDSVESPLPILDRNKNPTLSYLQGLNLPFLNDLKFVMLCGFFAFQGAQQAVAATDIASQLQSSSFLGDPGDISTGFASAFLLIFFSELGDKTFFIAALLAARNAAGVVFLGTFGALGAMTIISVIIGRTFHYVDDILPFRFGGADLPVDDIAAACLLIYFGVSTLLEASSADGGKADEEQKEAELAVSEFAGNGAGILAAASTVISTFLLVFVAEWGDKSFFSTIALAAASSPLGVVGGALAGHGVATLLAVLGGSLLGSFLSEKVVAYIGGTLFLVFAGVTLIEIVS